MGKRERGPDQRGSSWDGEVTKFEREAGDGMKAFSDRLNVESGVLRMTPSRQFEQNGRWWLKNKREMEKTEEGGKERWLILVIRD